MSATLYVENLPHDVNDQDLTEVFSSIGEVVAIKLHRICGDTEQCGYITMKDPRCACRAAHYLNGHPLFGQPMVVQRANNVMSRGPGKEPVLVQ